MKYEKTIITLTTRICTTIICVIFLPKCQIISGVCSCLFLWWFYAIISIIAIFFNDNHSICPNKSVMIAFIISICLGLIVAIDAIKLEHFFFAFITFITNVISVLAEYNTIAKK